MRAAGIHDRTRIPADRPSSDKVGIGPPPALFEIPNGVTAGDLLRIWGDLNSAVILSSYNLLFSLTPAVHRLLFGRLGKNDLLSYALL